MVKDEVCQFTHNMNPRRRRERGIENVFKEIMAENFPNLKKETYTQTQKAQRVPNQTNPNRSTPRHNIIKMVKVKDKKGF